MFRDPRVILSKMAPLAVTPDKLRGESSSSVSRKEVQLSAEVMELARGIEPPTCGLQKPTEAIPSDQESSDKSDESLDGKGE